MMTAREINEVDRRSRRGKVGLEVASSIRIQIDRGGISHILQDQTDSQLEVKLMVDCRRWLSIGVAGGCRGARSEGETKARRSRIVSNDEEVEDDCG